MRFGAEPWQLINSNIGSQNFPHERCRICIARASKSNSTAYWASGRMPTKLATYASTSSQFFRRHPAGYDHLSHIYVFTGFGRHKSYTPRAVFPCRSNKHQLISASCLAGRSPVFFTPGQANADGTTWMSGRHQDAMCVEAGNITPN